MKFTSDRTLACKIYYVRLFKVISSYDQRMMKINIRCVRIYKIWSWNLLYVDKVFFFFFCRRFEFSRPRRKFKSFLKFTSNCHPTVFSKMAIHCFVSEIISNGRFSCIKFPAAVRLLGCLFVSLRPAEWKHFSLCWYDEQRYSQFRHSEIDDI